MPRRIKRDHLTNVFGDLIDIAKFKSKQITQANGCIEYEGVNHRQGYQFVGKWRNGKNGFITAHRLAMKLKLGRNLDPKEQVIHTCSNVRCVNTDHLFIGDTRARVKNMSDNGRAAKTRPGARGPRIYRPQSRAYNYSIEEMVFMRTHTAKEIREKFGVDVKHSNRLKSAYTFGYHWLDNFVNK